MVSERVTQVLQRLPAFEWFRGAGTFSGGDRERAVQSWSEAVSLSESDEWQNLKLTFANDLGDKVRITSPQVYRGWNEVVRAIRPLSEAALVPAVSAYITSANLPNRTPIPSTMKIV
jgi:hypothetical protein